MNQSFLRVWWLVGLSSMVILNCGEDKTALTPGDSCMLNSDCKDPLICGLGRCHQQCHTDSDCATGAYCLPTTQGNICRLPDDKKCHYNSDCSDPKLVCAIDGQCRAQCKMDVDCPTPQLCVTSAAVDETAAPDKVCAAKPELTAGALPKERTVGGASSGGGTSKGGNQSSAGASGDFGSGGTLSGGGGTTSGGLSSVGAPEAGAGAGGAEAGSGGGPETSGTTGSGGTTSNGGSTSSGGVQTGSGGKVIITSGGSAQGGSAQGGTGGVPACIPTGNIGVHMAGGQFIQIPDSASLDTVDFTAETWVNFASAGVDTSIIQRPLGSGADQYTFAVYWRHSTGMLYGAVNWTADTDAVSNAWTPVPGRWYHIAFSYEHATGKQRLFIDGTLAVSGAAKGDPVYDAHPTLIGAYFTGNVIKPNAIADFDEVSIWPMARTETQIQGDRAAKATSPVTGASGFWTLDEGTGQVAHDATANHNDATLGATRDPEASDALWTPSSVPFGGQYQVPSTGVGLCGGGNCAKPDNKALHFGGNHYAQAADSASLHLTDFTFEAWVTTSVPPATGFTYGYSWLSSKQNSTSADTFSFIVGFQPTGKFGAGISPNAGIWFQWAPTPGRWYHVAFTYDHTTTAQKLYINEDLVASGTGAAPPTYDSEPWILGVDGDYGNRRDHWIGDMDEVRIWNSARTLDQIVGDMRTCQPASLDGLVAYWSFDEGTGQIVHDATANKNDLQLGSAVTADASDPTWISSTVPF